MDFNAGKTGLVLIDQSNSTSINNIILIVLQSITGTIDVKMDGSFLTKKVILTILKFLGLFFSIGLGFLHVLH